MTNDSILEQIIENRQNQIFADFQPKTILESLIVNLSDREKEVITHRYGLKSPDKKTLEEIGQMFKVTRERIRQIENAALRKIKNHAQFEALIKPVEQVISQSLEEHGGLMRHDFLLDNILVVPGNTPENRALVSFIIEQLLNNKLSVSGDNELTYTSWKSPSVDLETINAVLNAIGEVMHEIGEPITLEKIMEHLKKNKAEIAEKVNDKSLHSYMVASKKMEKNPYEEWGLVDWQTITPKRMSDKIYLILKKSGEPLHFTKIAEKINEVGFDHKQANPATIHNELILDKKYVLVGRGIYALKEWGFEPGVVADVIRQVLKENGPLSKEDIIKKVLEKRQVKKSTVVLALMNKNNFNKGADKKYSIV